jgi:hypothetical protein
MPNKKENDKTLLGIDSNNNGVRDDVEHYIFNRFKNSKNYRVEREIAMQRARATQLFMINPETGYQDGKSKLTEKMNSCLFYYYNEYLSANNITSSRDALEQIETIEGIWFKIARVKTDLALRNFIKRQTGKLPLYLNALTVKEAQNVINALLIMQKSGTK